MTNNVKQFIDSFNFYLHEKYNGEYPKDEYVITENDKIEYKGIKGLLEKFNFPERGYHESFVPYEDILQNNINPNWVAFGEYPGYNLCYVLDSESNEIILVDLDFNTVYMSCAPDEITFFKVFSILFHADVQPRNQKKIEDAHSEALKILGNGKYITFANHIFGV